MRFALAFNYVVTNTSTWQVLIYQSYFGMDILVISYFGMDRFWRVDQSAQFKYSLAFLTVIFLMALVGI